MTDAAVLAAGDQATLPGPGTLVLAIRPLRPGTGPAALSRFADDRWNLTPAVFAQHADAISLNFTTVVPGYRHLVKTMTWLVINHEPEQDMRFNVCAARPSPRTVVTIWRGLRDFTSWLDICGIQRFSDVTAADLDAYAEHVKAAPVNHAMREDQLTAVLRAWMLRHLLPEDGRLPAAPPWDGDRIKDILGTGRDHGENKTRRIAPATMTALLDWCLRFTEIFASDIIAAFDEYKHLSVRNYYTRKRESRLVTASARRPRGSVTAMLDELLGEYRAAGLALPGLRAADGTVAVNAYHLGRELDAQILPARAAAMAAAAGLPVDDDTYVRAPVTALLDNEPWLPHRIRYDQAPVLARHLSTACFVIIAYLTGQRPGETANLERGCLTRDTETGLVLLHGRHFKGATGDDGSHLPEGKIRDDPWVTVEPVATAVAVAGRLHDAQLLFPNTLLVNGSACAGSLGDRVGRARGQSHIGGDITSLVTWINQYCREQGRLDPVPPDPADPGLAPGRLRRTLAWFIVRKPRGLVAAAIQYGHVKVKMTLGYAGSYASGYPDELAFEQWLDRIDTLADAHQRLAAGEHVSGPAAAEYTARVTASARFAGRVARTSREAAAMLADPGLQIFPGTGMTCVLDPAKAACRLTGDDSGTRRTPDIGNCQPSCANIARTDRDIASVRQRADDLAGLVADPLAPPIRHQREQRELHRLHQIIEHHQETAP
jgi:integrase